MGVDKASIVWRGSRLVDRWVAALATAGAERTIVLHREPDAIAPMAVTVRPDDHGGQGPLDGILTALEICRAPVAVIVAVDLVVLTPHFDESGLVGMLVARLAEVDLGEPGSITAPGVVAVRTPDDGLQLLASAWRVERAVENVRSRFGHGERSVHALAGSFAVGTLDLPAGSIGNLNRPEDLVSGPDVAPRADD